MPPHVRSHCALSFEVGPIRLTFVEEVDSFKRPEKHQEDRITWGGNYQALPSDFFRSHQDHEPLEAPYNSQNDQTP